MATANKRRQHSGFKKLPTGPNGGIELLLIQSVPHVGKQGDVVEVKAGFANNYLLPQGLATVATDHHKRMVDKHRAKLEALAVKRIKGLKEQASHIGNQSVTIEANANDDGHLYGSVGAPEIVAALKEVEINISPEQIKLDGVLKELGLYTVKVQLHSDVDTELKVWVVPTVDGDESKPE